MMKNTKTYLGESTEISITIEVTEKQSSASNQFIENLRKVKMSDELVKIFESYGIQMKDRKD